MRLMIASDIHGSAYYTEKLLDAYSGEKCDKLLLLGDILYHGPRNDLPREYNPKRVIDMLNNVSSELLCVRGNCEAEVDQMVLDFQVMAEYAVFYIKGRMIFATHGHIYNETFFPKLKKGDILLHGHTHVPALKKINNGENIYMNPGSVSIPKENSHHGYMIIEDMSYSENSEDIGPVAEWKKLDGEVLWNYTL